MAQRVVARNEENVPNMVNSGSSNLLMKTHAAKSREEARLSQVGEIRPEKDPFWNARSAQRDEARGNNPYSISIKENASSRLLQPTAASIHGSRKKVEVELRDKTKEDSQQKKIRHISNDCNVLRPTTAFRTKKTTEPEPTEMSDEIVVRTLNEFGNIPSKNVRGGGTWGFGLALPGPPPQQDIAAARPPAPPAKAVAASLLGATSASRAHAIAQFKEHKAQTIRSFTTPKKAPGPNSRIMNPNARIYDVPLDRTHIPKPRVNKVERGWNSCTTKAHSLDAKATQDTKKVRDQDNTPVILAAKPTDQRAFAVASKQTAAAAFRNVKSENVTSDIALKILRENEKPKEVVRKPSRMSLNAMRPTAASVARRRETFEPKKTDFQLQNDSTELAAKEAPPAEILSSASPEADVFFAMKEPEVIAASKEVLLTPKFTKKTTPKQATPKQATPKQATPKQATPKQATAKKATPKQATPKQATPKQATPKQATPKQATAKKTTPKKATAKKATPKKIVKEISEVDQEEFSMTEEEAILYKSIVASTVASARGTTQNQKKMTTVKSPKIKKVANSTPSKAESAIKTPIINLEPPSTLSLDGTPVASTITARQTRSSAKKARVTDSSPIKDFDLDDITQDVAALLQDSPHRAVVSRSGKPLTPATNSVAKCEESPITPTNIDSTKRVTRSQKRLTPK